jgi:hypothetical protein
MSPDDDREQTVNPSFSPHPESGNGINTAQNDKHKAAAPQKRRRHPPYQVDDPVSAGDTERHRQQLFSDDLDGFGQTGDSASTCLLGSIPCGRSPPPPLL